MHFDFYTDKMTEDLRAFSLLGSNIFLKDMRMRRFVRT